MKGVMTDAGLDIAQNDVADDLVDVLFIFRSSIERGRIVLAAAIFILKKALFVTFTESQFSCDQLQLSIGEAEGF